MPRLTDSDYLLAHHFLKDAWEIHDGIAFGLLLWHEQRALHDYFLPTKKLDSAHLLMHRREVTRAHPSLPHRAGKALVRCRGNVAEFDRRPPVPYVRKRGRPERSMQHRIVVRAVARPEFGPEHRAKLAKVLIRLATEGAH